MKTQLLPTALYRIPKFPINATLQESWQELKTAISLSSTEFYQTIKDIKPEELTSLPAPIQHTIWKYFNRARFRATPYATFASVGLCEIKSRPEDPTLTLQENTTVHAFTDWSHKEDITITREQIQSDDLLLFANSSHYQVSEGIRYISHLEGSFQLSEIDDNQLANQILKESAKPVRYSILSQKLKEQGHPTPAVLDMVTELIDLQLLLSSQHANIIGEDYFQRIGVPIEQFPGQYLLCQRGSTGNLDAETFRHLPAAIEILHQLVPHSEPEPLKQFTSRFSQKFEGQQVPLMQALDPELGVGYGDFETAGDSDELIAKFTSRKTSDNSTQASDKFKNILLGKLIQSSPDTTKTIQLEDLLAQKRETENNSNTKSEENNSKAPLPNSVAVLASLSGEQLWIDSIGGTTANTLLGRFTLTGEGFHDHCKNIAELEQLANPEVLFFDVAYIAEGKVDNVNRRKAIYPLQLSILNFDTSKDPLRLDDLLVYMQGGQLMLRSKSLNKRLIPRFSTAYNYSRSDLSLFRFMCDLQNQHLQTNLNLGLRNVLPDADHYPRVQYKNIILSPATWKISYSELRKNSTDTTNSEALQTLLKQKNTAQFFRAGTGDQTLRYDSQNQPDLENLLAALKKQKTLYIEEAQDQTHSPVKDHSGQSYHCQLLLALTHSSELYRDIPIKKTETPSPGIQRNIAPGKDWLYFELYCHPQRREALLLGPIRYLLDNHKADIKKWFFINYNENGEHIRLRLQLNEKGQNHAYRIIAEMNEILDEAVQNGTISDLQIKTYKRETHRYGWETIQDIESHFCKDSEHVLNLLEAELANTDKYQLCVNLMLEIRESGALEEKEFDYTINKVSNSFNAEHNLQPADFGELNALYRSFKAQQPPDLDQKQQESQTALLNSYTSSLDLFEKIPKRSILSDLFHMHVNRLFSSNQRTHEMVIYYLLTKEIQRRDAQQKKAPESLHLQQNIH